MFLAKTLKMYKHITEKGAINSLHLQDIRNVFRINDITDVFKGEKDSGCWGQ